MSIKKFNLKNTIAKAASSFLLLSFFVCIIHITPQAFHHEQASHEEQNTTENHEKSHSENISCVDDESYTIGTKNSLFDNLLLAILPTPFAKIAVQTEPANKVYFLDAVAKEKVPIYLKNNILLI